MVRLNPPPAARTRSATRIASGVLVAPILLALLLAPDALASPRLAGALTPGESDWRDDLTPLGDAEWSRERAAHLLERAGFGGTPEEVDAWAALGPQAAVEKLVRWQSQPNRPLAPFLHSGIFPSEDFVPPGDGDLERIVLRAALFRRGLGVKIRWNFDEAWLQPLFDQFFYLLFANAGEMTRVAHWQAERMLRTRRPLEEKMALFWHGHFATSNEKVRDYRKMKRQWELFREKGNGPFGELLLGICRDPAMLVYLDGSQNVRGSPNENFAREIMELFALGVGHYGEADVKDAARAFTGWGLDGNDFDRSFWRHDRGKKQVLGRRGRLDGEDVVEVILEQPEAARFLATKIYRYFVREDPSPAVIDALAADLRENHHDVGRLLERIFRSRDFYSDATVGTRIKPPVELIVSTYRKLGLDEVPGAPFFSTTAAAMGQELYMPPNVAGWKGGRTWINPSTLMLRQNFARHLLFPQEIPPLEKSLMETIVVAVVGQDLYDQMKEMAASGDRSHPPRVGMEDMGFARVQELDTNAFSLPWAVYNGAEKALGAVRFDIAPIARFRISDDLKEAGVSDASGAVRYLSERFLRVPLRAADRRALESRMRELAGGKRLDLDDPATERGLRELLHLLMSLPEYQLS